jgi:uncharacterized membrane protein YbhN (UPF0104 family)
MNRERRAWVWWTLGFIGLLLALRTVFQFPWKGTLAALANANPWLLLMAAAINLLSPLCKGFGWYALARRLAPCRIWVVQEANLLGAAVNSVSVGPTGEATRIAVLVERDPVPMRVALLSVAASRVTEGLALAGFLIFAPLLLDLPPWTRTLQLGSAIAFVIVFAGSRTQVWRTNARTFLVAVAFGIASWAAEWVVYHLVLRATLGSIPWSASFTALIAVNLGGLLRLTPGNTGVLQASMVAGLLPFGIPLGQAVAAGLALQGIETLPILLLCLPLVVRGAAHSRRVAATAPPTSGPGETVGTAYLEAPDSGTSS